MNRGNFNLGDEIRFIVQDAVNNRDFNRLNHDIRNIVNGALDEVRNSLGGNRRDHEPWNHQTWKVNDYSQSYDQNSQTWNFNNNQQWHENNSQTQNAQNSSGHKYNHNNMNNYTHRHGYKQNKQEQKSENTVPVGKVLGMLLTIFGSIGSIGLLIAMIVLAIIGYSLENSVMYTIIAFILLPCFIVSMTLLLNGSRIRKRLKRHKRYILQMHNRNYCMIKDLSSVTGRSAKYIAKDLQKMIDIGMFPEGHMDDKKTCFMLNNESYEQYLNLQENMRMREAEEQEKKKEETLYREQTEENKRDKKDTLDPKISKAIDEGRQYVQKIKNANIEIPGEEISRKLDRLEDVTGKIFDYVETHPEKFPEIKKFTEYFLPTTLKLLDAYREFEYQPVVGTNISAAKKEIEETMDTINHAFENLLDSLFEDVAMDISTDISVMETMFAQEGLSQKNKK
nr:5-bromo-4-chloroindolyl phosphate hydrolysis family protein [Sedimentibacter sp.]